MDRLRAGDIEPFDVVLSFRCATRRRLLEPRCAPTGRGQQGSPTRPRHDPLPFSSPFPSIHCRISVAQAGPCGELDGPDWSWPGASQCAEPVPGRFRGRIYRRGWISQVRIRWLRCGRVRPVVGRPLRRGAACVIGRPARRRTGQERQLAVTASMPLADRQAFRSPGGTR